MKQKQQTISTIISCYGIGIHSGEYVQLTLKPAKENTGIVFVRTDVKTINNAIEVSYLNVSDTSFSTNIKNSSQVSVGTIEHLMAAIWGGGVDNLIIEIDGPEVPAMDGSSKAFLFMIECAGKKVQAAPRRYLRILKEIEVSHNDAQIIAAPSSSVNIDLTIDFDSKVIGKQYFSFSERLSFKDEIANARTFGFIQDLEYLKKQGLVQGASLENAIGIDQGNVLNATGLRYKDEFVRHKLLDLCGDLYTAGGRIVGAITGYKTGHTLNNQFLCQLFSNPAAYEWVGSKEL